MELQIHSLEEFNSWVEEIKLKFKDKQLILLSGAMGAGKTQFVQSLVGANADVMSPTFAIHNRYEWDKHSVDHIDLYRLEDEADLESTGFWDVFEQQDGWVLIEWADRLPKGAYPLNWPTVSINISVDDENENYRNISVEGLS